jgi:hypothetical protein
MFIIYTDYFRLIHTHCQNLTLTFLHGYSKANEVCNIFYYYVLDTCK